MPQSVKGWFHRVIPVKPNKYRRSGAADATKVSSCVASAACT